MNIVYLRIIGSLLKNNENTNNRQTFEHNNYLQRPTYNGSKLWEMTYYQHVAFNEAYYD